MLGDLRIRFLMMEVFCFMGNKQKQNERHVAYIHPMRWNMCQSPWLQELYEMGEGVKGKLIVKQEHRPTLWDNARPIVMKVIFAELSFCFFVARVKI